ncbi:MAG: ABC transporter permease [Bacteroidota bacterium]
MFRNYIKIALRNLWRRKTFSAINIAGLAIGIAVCFIILLFIQDELSYDRFNEKADRIVRISFNASINGGKINEPHVMPPVAQTLKKDYPEVEEATRLRTYGTPKVIYGTKIFKGASLAYVDSNFFQVFTITLLIGDKPTALLKPNSIVLTEETAKKYFGNTEPIGKILSLTNDGVLYTVTGIMEKIPTSAHFHFDMLGSMNSLQDAREQSWLKSDYFTYLLLTKGYDYKKLEGKLPAVVKTYMGPQIAQSMGLSLDQFHSKGNELGFALQPLTDIHLHSNGHYEIEPAGNAQYIYIFGAIAIFMLLIACINFINLSTAGASKRSKEVGVRKVMGSLRTDLIKQFLLESVLVTLLALIVTLILVQIALPEFNQLAGKNLALGFNSKTILPILTLTLLVGLLAGVYPAFFLSSFNPVRVLKSRFVPAGKTISLRSGLVVFQFFISVGLMIGTTVVYQQLKYIQNKQLGYDKEQLLVLNNSWALGKNEQVFKNELLKDSRVLNIAISSYRPAGQTNSNNTLIYPDGKDNELTKILKYHIDEAYIPTMGMQLVQGRNFSKALSTDSSGIIINEAAARSFGWGNSAVGHTITQADYNAGQKRDFTVIGVVKDFHFRSLHESIAPVIMALHPQWGLIVKMKGSDANGLIATMKKQWAGFNTTEPFDYAFMDDLYNKTYIAEQKTGRILNIFALLTILVACLGLFGLATFTAEQRTREIGIRKVLGASASQITNMLSKEFIKLVLIACGIAFPVSYWTMHKWLQDFAYRVDISWWIFPVVSLAAIAIALLTISFQAIKAAIANPVNSLRNE